MEIDAVASKNGVDASHCLGDDGSMGAREKLRGGSRWERVEQPSVCRAVYDWIRKRQAEIFCALTCCGVISIGVAEHFGAFNRPVEERKLGEEVSEGDSYRSAVDKMMGEVRRGYPDGMFRSGTFRSEWQRLSIDRGGFRLEEEKREEF